MLRLPKIMLWEANTSNTNEQLAPSRCCSFGIRKAILVPENRGWKNPEKNLLITEDYGE
jgi:hypothetical protein